MENITERDNTQALNHLKRISHDRSPSNVKKTSRILIVRLCVENPTPLDLHVVSNRG